MIVSDSRRLLFVHIQKTGGISVERVLLSRVPDATAVTGLRWNRHATLASVLEARPETADYWTFGFVRNPWARLWSWYSMIQRRQQAAAAGNEVVARSIADNPFWRDVLAFLPTFEAFVLEGPARFRRLHTPQVDYLRTAGRSADFVGRTERLDDDLAEVWRHLGVTPPQRTPHVNAGPGGGYRSHYSTEMRSQVARLFAADLDEYDYRF